MASAGRAPALGRSPTAGEVGSPPAGEMRGGRVKHQGLRRSGTLPNGASAFRGGGGLPVRPALRFLVSPSPQYPGLLCPRLLPSPAVLSLCFFLFVTLSLSSLPPPLSRPHLSPVSVPLPLSLPPSRPLVAREPVGVPRRGVRRSPEQLIMTAPLRLGDLLLLSGGIPTPREGASRGGRAGQGRRPAD